MSADASRSRARPDFDTARGDQRAGACIAQRIVVLKRDREMRGNAREIVSSEPRKRATRHRNSARHAERQWSAERTFDLKAIKGRVVRNEERCRVARIGIGEELWCARFFDRTLDEFEHRSPRRGERGCARDAIGRDAVNRDETRIKTHLWVEIPVSFADDFTAKDECHAECTNRAVRWRGRFDIESNNWTRMLRRDAGNSSARKSRSACHALLAFRRGWVGSRLVVG